MKKLFQGHVGTEGTEITREIAGLEMGNVQNGILTNILLLLLFLVVLTKKVCGHIKV